MSGCVAVFDLGKTNIKVVAFDASGKVLAERARPNAPLAPDAHCPYLSLDTEGAWAFLLGALKDIGAQVPIEAISIAAHGAAGALVTDKGPRLAPNGLRVRRLPVVDADYDAARPPFEEAQSPHLPRGLNLGASRSISSACFPPNSHALPPFSPIRNIGPGA